ncbi:MAG: hypothetical protein AAFY28_08615 [Actinomycetota bacterium]
MTRGRRLPLLLAPFVAVALLAGCSDDNGDSDSEPQDDCEASMQEAAEVSNDEQAITDIDPAIANCPDVASFVDASNKYPDALDGQDPQTFISDRCADSAQGDICDEIAP